MPQVGALCYLSSFSFLRWAYLKVTVTKETKRSFIHCFICQMTTIARTGWTWVDLGGPGCLELHPAVTPRWQGPSTWDAFCCFPRFIISAGSEEESMGCQHFIQQDNLPALPSLPSLRHKMTFPHWPKKVLRMPDLHSYSLEFPFFHVWNYFLPTVHSQLWGQYWHSCWVKHMKITEQK